MKGFCASKFSIKICGKRHAWCKICKPDRNIDIYSKKKFGFVNYEIHKKAMKTKVKNGSCAGEKNPNWRGGRVEYSLAGWKEARRRVWERDKSMPIMRKITHISKI